MRGQAIGKLLLGLLVGLALLLAGLKGYFWYKTKDAVDRLQALAKPFVALRYQGIATELGGRIAIEGIELQPQGSQEVIRIASLGVETESLWDFLALRDLKSIEDLPQQLHVSLQGLRLLVDSPLIFALEKAQREAPVGANQWLKWPPLLECDAKSSMAELKKLGYEEIKQDLRFGYEKQAGDRWHLSQQTRIDCIYELDFSLELSAAQKGQFQTWLANSPKLEQGSLQYRDLGYLDRKISRCASEREWQPFELVERYLSQLKEQLAAGGASLDIQHWSDYRAFLLGPTVAQLAIRPLQPLDLQSLEQLSFYSGAGVTERLGIQLGLNGRPLEPLQIQWSLESADFPITSLLEQMQTFDAAATQEQERNRASRSILWRTVRVGDLGKYTGLRARLVSRSGQQYEGELRGISAKGIALSMADGGSGTLYHFPTSQIRRASVLR